MRRFLLLLFVPGLAGSLIVGLSLLYLFQTDWLHRAYDTPLPLTMALVLFLAPRALLVQLLLRAAQPREPAALARLLAGSGNGRQRRRAGALLWRLRRQRHFWAGALLAFWAYWDLTSASMLHPSSMVPAPVRLYNLMHYGHNAVLSTMTFVAVAVPLLVAWIVASVLRPFAARFVQGLSGHESGIGG
jgi:iron(III) transport system permease protein